MFCTFKRYTLYSLTDHYPLLSLCFTYVICSSIYLFDHVADIRQTYRMVLVVRRYILACKLFDTVGIDFFVLLWPQLSICSLKFTAIKCGIYLGSITHSVVCCVR